MEASDEEFDTEEVRKLVKRLDELDPIPLPWKSDEEALKDFWDYCEERQREERIIAEISNVGNREYEIKMGDKVGQLVIMPVLIPDFTFENWKERVVRGLLVPLGDKENLFAEILLDFKRQVLQDLL